MNRERAETYLRLVAEAELRQLTADPHDRAALLAISGDRPEPAGLMARPPVAAALRTLDDRQREAITLQYDEGLSEAETAAAMQISPRAVRSHTPSGMSTLRAELETGYRARRVASALTAVGALDERVAAQILAEFRLILAVRQAGSAGQRMPRLLGLAASRGSPAAWASSPSSSARRAEPPAAPGRILQLGQMIPFQRADGVSELYVLSYARVGSGPQLSVFGRTLDQSGQWQLAGPRFFEHFTATDDLGTSYHLKIRDIGSGPMGWTLMLRPNLPHDPRWLDLNPLPGDPPVRIELDRQPSETHPAEVTVQKTALSPGEYLLHTIAARLLTAAVSGPLDWPPMSGLTSGALTRLANGLGQIIEAFQACGAVSPLSPVPAQLAAICAELNVEGHGITAAPAADLPEPWLSVLASSRRPSTGAAAERDGYAAPAIMLPEHDGISLALLGLQHSPDATIMHMHASGPRSDVIYGPDDLYPWAALWVRDRGGPWHATRLLARSGMNGEVALRVEVLPPLSPAPAQIELLVAGPSAEIHATVPLHWQSIPTS